MNETADSIRYLANFLGAAGLFVGCGLYAVANAIRDSFEGVCEGCGEDDE